MKVLWKDGEEVVLTTRVFKKLRKLEEDLNMSFMTIIPEPEPSEDKRRRAVVLFEEVFANSPEWEHTPIKEPVKELLATLNRNYLLIIYSRNANTLNERSNIIEYFKNNGVSVHFIYSIIPEHEVLIHSYNLEEAIAKFVGK